MDYKERITVELLIKKLSEGITIQGLLKVYPHLTKEYILAALAYSADALSREDLDVK